jgi:hypothetical protein
VLSGRTPLSLLSGRKPLLMFLSGRTPLSTHDRHFVLPFYLLMSPHVSDLYLAHGPSSHVRTLAMMMENVMMMMMMMMMAMVMMMMMMMMMMVMMVMMIMIMMIKMMRMMIPNDDMMPPQCVLA